MGDQRHLEWAQGAQLLENEGETSSTLREHYLQEQSRARSYPGGLVALAHIFWP